MFQVPNTEDDWKKIEKVFELRWNFPNCCGAIDGKHVQVKCPNNSGSEFFNYKKTFSIILFALVDGDYCFKFIDVGGNGRASDSTIFRESSLNVSMLNNSLHLPKRSVIIGDDAFPLRSDLLKPYSRKKLTVKQAVFNYRLSRARRVVENAFGILASRFRLLLRPIEAQPRTVDFIIQASCALHNWLRITTAASYFTSGLVDFEDIDNGTITLGSWRSEICAPLTSVSAVGSNNYARSASELRNTYADYFQNEGSVPWQLKAIGITNVDHCISISEEDSDEDDILI